MFGLFDISASGLAAQRIRQDTVACNVANANTPADPATGCAYRRQVPLFAEAIDKSTGRCAGVRVAAVVEDASPLKRVYEPGNPAAVDGYVIYPNVDLGTEVVNMLEATRAYEANIAAIESTKAMLSATMRLLA